MALPRGLVKSMAFNHLERLGGSLVEGFATLLPCMAFRCVAMVDDGATTLVDVHFFSGDFCAVLT